MEYDLHVDNAIMNRLDSLRTDISVTLFLNDPSEYDGGELIVHTSDGERKAKLKAGEAVIYDATRIHRVTPVTRGIRLAVLTWVQNFIRDPEKRLMLADLVSIQQTLHDKAPDESGTDMAFNLCRMWADT